MEDGLTRAVTLSSRMISGVADVEKTPEGTTPAGWYQDPSVPGVVRFFDGNQWTEHTQPEDVGPLVEKFHRRRRRYRMVRSSLAWVLAVVLGALVVLAPNPTNCPLLPPDRDRAVCQSLADGLFVVPEWLQWANAWLWLLALVLAVVVLRWRDPRAPSQGRSPRSGRQVVFFVAVVLVLAGVLVAAVLSAMTSLGSVMAAPTSSSVYLY